MIADNLGRQLHHKATLGIALSPDDSARLEAWYAQQDQGERELLGATISHPKAGDAQTRVESALEQLRAAAQRVQAIAAENETLRGENAILQARLVQRDKAQMA